MLNEGVAGGIADFTRYWQRSSCINRIDDASRLARGALLATHLSWNEPSILPVDVGRQRLCRPPRHQPDVWRQTIDVARSECGCCIACPYIPQNTFGPKSGQAQCPAPGESDVRSRHLYVQHCRHAAAVDASWQLKACKTLTAI